MANRFVRPRRQQVVIGTADPSVAYSDSSPFRGTQIAPNRVFHERRGVREADGGVHQRRNWELQSMVPNFAFYPAAASGTGHCPADNAGSTIRRESCGFEEIGNSTIYGSQFRVLSRGSNRLSALPTGSNRNRALPGGNIVHETGNVMYVSACGFGL